MKIYIVLLVFCLECFQAMAQTDVDSIKNERFTINKITICGNRKTKSHIILRELNIHPGDTIYLADTAQIIKTNISHLTNTQLFLSSSIIFLDNPEKPQTKDVFITIEERWYIFFIPIVDIADRNFNEWWERGHKLNRLVYGINIKYSNFRGRKEILDLTLQGGFTNKYELFYTIPYLNKNQKSGIKIKFHYSTNKNVAYETYANKLHYLKEEKILRERFFTGLSYTRRSKLYGTHEVELLYRSNWVNDTISKLNPDYFFLGKNRQRFLEATYYFAFNKTNRVNYPTKGYNIKTSIKKLGLTTNSDLNQWHAGYTISKYIELGRNFSFAHNLNYFYNSSNKTPFIYNTGLGYQEQVVRGYQLYVINSTHFYVQRNEFRKKLFDIKVDISDFLNISEFNKIPYGVYFKTFFDHGYGKDKTYNPKNALLANKYLFAYGLGVDVVTFYDLVLRVEIARNSIKQNGLFFSLVKAI